MIEEVEPYAIALLKNGKRIDGRRFDEFRKISYETGIIKNAEGSARVKIGKTEIITGVKMEIGEPFKDTPSEGILIVNAEFTPLASPDFEPGPPGEDAIELARVVDRGIRESECVDMESLCIEEGEKVWKLFVDIHVMNHDGNLIDASALASVLALHNTKIPKLEDGEIVRGEYERDLQVKFKPVTVTVCKVCGKLLVDPIFEEESVVDAKLSVCARDDGKICALQKGGSGIKFEDVKEMIGLAVKKIEEVRKEVWR